MRASGAPAHPDDRRAERHRWRDVCRCSPAPERRSSRPTIPRRCTKRPARRLIERLGEGSAVAAQLEVLIVHLGNRVDRLIAAAERSAGEARSMAASRHARARAATDLRDDAGSDAAKRGRASSCSRSVQALGEERRRELLQLHRIRRRAICSTSDRLRRRRRAAAGSLRQHRGAADARQQSQPAGVAGDRSDAVQEGRSGQLYETVTDATRLSDDATATSRRAC